MSIQRVFQLIRNHFSTDVVNALQAEIAEKPNAHEVTVPGGSIYKIADPKNLHSLMKQRARHCPEPVFQQALEKQVALLRRAIDNDQEDALWGAYFVKNDRHTGFVVNLRSGEVAIS